MREVAGHVDDVNLVVADDAQVLDEPLGVHHLAAPNHLGQVCIEAALSRSRIARGGQGSDDDLGRSGRNLPKGSGASFLNLRMRRQILEWQYVVCGQADDGVRRERARQLGQ